MARQNIEGLEGLSQPCLRKYIKFVFFEDSNLQKVQFRDLQDFSEADMKSNGSGNGSGIDGMMEKFLANMLGGEDNDADPRCNDQLMSLMGGSGSNDQKIESNNDIDQLMQMMMKGNGTPKMGLQ